jgi:hypothetical protein
MEILQLPCSRRYWPANTPQLLSSESESELLYDWRFTANQFVLATSPLRLMATNFFSTEPLPSQSSCNILSDERMGLSFIIAACPRQRSHSRVRIPLDSWSYFTVSDSRLPQPGGPGPRIYIPQEQGGPVLSPGTGFPSSSPPATSRATVEIFKLASTRPSH